MTMSDYRIAERGGRLFTWVFLACIGLLAGALYLQHWKNLDPCPWCIVQRLDFMLIGLIALAAALHRPDWLGVTVYASLGFLASAAGIGIAGYHIWLQADPSRAGCIGSPLERWLDQIAIGKMIPPLLQYDGPCTLKPWSFLGLSVPEWSFAWFVILAGVFVWIAIAVRR
jgi:disulfide bond formation protein DsbB